MKCFSTNNHHLNLKQAWLVLVFLIFSIISETGFSAETVFLVDEDGVAHPDSDFFQRQLSRKALANLVKSAKSIAWNFSISKALDGTNQLIARYGLNRPHLMLDSYEIDLMRQALVDHNGQVIIPVTGKTPNPYSLEFKSTVKNMPEWLFHGYERNYGPEESTRKPHVMSSDEVFHQGLRSHFIDKGGRVEDINELTISHNHFKYGLFIKEFLSHLNWDQTSKFVATSAYLQQASRYNQEDIYIVANHQDSISVNSFLATMEFEKLHALFNKKVRRVNVQTFDDYLFSMRFQHEFSFPYSISSQYIYGVYNSKTNVLKFNPYFRNP